MRTTDVLVIGSGFGAAAPALRLAEAGYSVLMIEKGVRPRFRQTQDPKYVRKYIKSLEGDHLSLTFAQALGGGSGFYEMVSLRAPSRAFEQEDANGRPLWPAGLDRRALDPYYDLAESMLRVEQIPTDQVPKSGLVFARLMKNLGYSCDRARYAVRGCVGSGFCVTGCIYGAKQSLLLNYLPRAAQAGATIETGIEAVSIRALSEPELPRYGRPLTSLPYRYEVVCRSLAQPPEWRRVHARLVVLAGGTVGTARLLLASRKQLRRLSPHVGRNIAFNGSVKAAGILPHGFPDGDMFTGRSHPGMISYEFLQSHGLTIAAAKPLPLQAVASARLRLDGDAREPWYWGESNVELMQLVRRRMIVLVSFGLTPPCAELGQGSHGRMRLRLPLNEALHAHARQAQDLLESILTRNQCRLVHAEWLDGHGAPRNGLSFSTAHQTGSCRMADSKRAGAVDALGEVFSYPGLYVADGAAVPSSLAVNTSLTILANAERIAAGILDRHPPVRHLTGGAGARSASPASLPAGSQADAFGAAAG